jgi:hypothetical protein
MHGDAMSPLDASTWDEDQARKRPGAPRERLLSGIGHPDRGWVMVFSETDATCESSQKRSRRAARPDQTAQARLGPLSSTESLSRHLRSIAARIRFLIAQTAERNTWRAIASIWAPTNPFRCSVHSVSEVKISGGSIGCFAWSKGW